METFGRWKISYVKAQFKKVQPELCFTTPVFRTPLGRIGEREGRVSVRACGRLHHRPMHRGGRQGFASLFLNAGPSCRNTLRCI